MIAEILCAQSYYYTLNVTIDGLKYRLYEKEHRAMVGNRNQWEGELVIPEEVTHKGETYVVDCMLWQAFCGSNLTKVRIPKTILRFAYEGGANPSDKNPFDECGNLEYIEVDEENPSMCSIDGVLFSKDKSELYSYPGGVKAESYMVPDHVTSLGGCAFSCNPYIQSVVIPNSVTEMYGLVFARCKALRSVRLSENLRFIGAYSFESCDNLRFLDIPESVNLLCEGMFRWTPIDVLVVRGTFPNGLQPDLFSFMSTSAVIYVQPSEIEKFKYVYHGTVLPLEAYTTDVATTNKQKSDSKGFHYDLHGRKTGHSYTLPKGVYIQNGKKIIIN